MADSKQTGGERHLPSQAGSPVAPSVPKRGVLARIFLPFAGASKHLGADLKNSVLTPGSRAQKTLASHVSGEWSSARQAWQAPPRWQSIEALEADWGIDDTNRDTFVARQKLGRLVYGVMIGLVLAALTQFAPQSMVFLITGFLSFLSLLSVLSLKLSILWWRINVLERREPSNFPDWLMGRR